MVQYGNGNMNPMVGMGMPVVGSGTGNQLLSKTGENLMGVLKNAINLVTNTLVELQKNGIMLYLVLILVGFAIYYILRYFIGIRLGRMQAETNAKKQIQKQN